MGSIPFSVMTYNVHSCIGTDGRADVERIAEVIAPFACDVVALQELDMETARSGGRDQAREIADMVLMHYHFQPLLWLERGRYGNAILSRHPLTVLRAAELPTLAGRPRIERRGAIWARIAIGAVDVQVVSTHLGLNGRERRMQAEALLGPEWAGSPEFREPLVLCGDFNASPASAVCRMIRGRFRDAAREAGPAGSATWPSRFPLFRLDYVFLAGDIRVRQIFVHRTPLTRAASDHLPVVADLELATP